MSSTDARDQFGRAAESYVTSAWHNQPDALKALAHRVGQVGGKIADIGTGTGHTAFAFAELADLVYAVDITPQMLQVVSREAAKLGLTNVECVLADAEKMPFNDASLDGITCRVAAHHFKSVTDFASECARTIRPGGWVVLIDTVGPENDSDRLSIDHIERLRDPSHIQNHKVSEWLSYFAEDFDLEWQESQPKPLKLQDWMDRMRVPEEQQENIRNLILESTGGVREYLNPRMEEGLETFSLLEASIFARRKLRN